MVLVQLGMGPKRYPWTRIAIDQVLVVAGAISIISISAFKHKLEFVDFTPFVHVEFA